MKKNIFLTTACALVFGLTVPAAHAAVYSNGTAASQFNITLVIQADCVITANALNFGATGVWTSPLNQQTTVSVTCTNGTPYNVGVDGGSVAGSTPTARLIAGTSAGNTSTTVKIALFQ
ncbi:MAG TPA: spore coat protein U domain-containing protein, partial [Trinickia sp.]|nr:spore coat protein U domain-containing protein [Trinickia sp.]